MFSLCHAVEFINHSWFDIHSSVGDDCVYETIKGPEDTENGTVPFHYITYRRQKHTGGPVTHTVCSLYAAKHNPKSN